MKTLGFLILTALVPTACGGGSSNTTGPTDTTAAAVPAPAPPPKPAPPPLRFQMTAIALGLRSPGGSNGGCVGGRNHRGPYQTPHITR
jgi:hypothetical protein